MSEAVAAAGRMLPMAGRHHFICGFEDFYGMTEDATKHFKVRDLRVIMSLLVLVGALVFGSLAWSVLGAFVVSGSRPILSALVVLAATAVGAAGSVLAIGRIIRWRVPQVADAAPPADEERNEADEEAELLGNIINSMEGGVMTISSAGTITSFNAVAQRTLGHRAHDVVGKHFGAVFANVPENRSLREMIMSALTAHRTASSVEVDAVAANGSTVALGVTVSLLRGEAGRHRGVVLSFKSLADLNRLREQVERTRHLAYLGRLAAGMAHEIRNPLGSVRGLVELMGEDFDENDRRREYTATILRTVDRLNTLVESLLDFSQPAVTNMERVDLRELTRECVQLCSMQQDERRVKLKEFYPAGSLWVLADHDAMVRAVMNLVRNAYQATPDGGVIAVSVHGIAPRHNEDPGRAVIAVTNSGSYVHADDRGRLFTPFYTTKSDGTGLGLPIANQIVTAHSGQIEVESEMDTGTTFNVVLPICAVAKEPALAAASGAAE